MWQSFFQVMKYFGVKRILLGAAGLFVVSIFLSHLAAAETGWGTITQVRGKAFIVDSLDQPSSAGEPVSPGFILRNEMAVKLEEGSMVELIPCSGRGVITIEKSQVVVFEGSCAAGISLARVNSYRQSHQRSNYGKIGGERSGKEKNVQILFPRGAYFGGGEVLARWAIDPKVPGEVKLTKISLQNMESSETLFEQKIDNSQSEAALKVQLEPGGYYLFILKYSVDGKKKKIKKSFQALDSGRQKEIALELQKIDQRKDAPKIKSFFKLMLFEQNELYYEASKIHHEVYTE